MDEQIKEHKANAKVALALHFDGELEAAEECVERSAGGICPSDLGGDAKYNFKSTRKVIRFAVAAATELFHQEFRISIVWGETLTLLQ